MREVIVEERKIGDESLASMVNAQEEEEEEKEIEEEEWKEGSLFVFSIYLSKYRGRSPYIHTYI